MALGASSCRRHGYRRVLVRSVAFVDACAHAFPFAYADAFPDAFAYTYTYTYPFTCAHIVSDATGWRRE
jgi:hypothetical protein